MHKKLKGYCVGVSLLLKACNHCAFSIDFPASSIPFFFFAAAKRPQICVKNKRWMRSTNTQTHFHLQPVCWIELHFYPRPSPVSSLLPSNIIRHRPAPFYNAVDPRVQPCSLINQVKCVSGLSMWTRLRFWSQREISCVRPFLPRICSSLPPPKLPWDCTQRSFCPSHICRPGMRKSNSAW